MNSAFSQFAEQWPITPQLTPPPPHPLIHFLFDLLLDCVHISNL